MAKHKKQTPQEIYWERKKREEEEKDASLPPGLINHGNTCFMNSTLQGLIATQPLRDLVFFQPVAPALQPADGSPILAKRSPQLTNGHGLGGSDELEWTEGMPLGDIFTTIMRKAWGIQDAKRRETMSPKEILTTIGRKYDQYLDFRQQDAHEFLRHMLDAMRMEELDIIKRRQPPPPKSRRKRRDITSNAALPSPALPLPDSASQTSQPSSLAAPHSEHDASRREPQSRPQSQQSQGREQEDKLESFVDMLFGGQLASILVCEKCKKVSVTYEDFNDLSLSIKPEDYVKNRKRDRFKRIARKLRIRPPAPHEQLSQQDQQGQALGQEIDHAAPRLRGRGMFSAIQRASSVPTSPVRRSSEVSAREEPPTHEDPRRKSFDHAGGDGDEARDVVKEMAGAGLPPSSLASAIDEQDEEDAPEEITHAEAAEAAEQPKIDTDGATAEAAGEEKAKEKEKKERDDAWGKIARRISVSMKLSGAREKDKDKDREQRDSRPSSRQGERGRRTDIKDAFRVMRSGEPRAPRPGSVVPGASVHETGSEAGDVSDAPRHRVSSPDPASPLISSPLAQSSRPSSSRRSSTNPFSHHHHHNPRRKDERGHSFAPPKMSDEEMAYLRQVLADVHPVTGNPLSILQNAFTGGSGSSSGSSALTTHALWAKVGHLPGIEECLRMFTAVEILDGENMVGCHRCWKIANGLYKPHNRDGDNGGEGDSESSSENNSESSTSASDSSGTSDASGVKPPSVSSRTHPVVPDLQDMDDSAQQSSPDLSSGRISPASTSFVSTQTGNHSSTADDTTSISSAPTTDSVLASGTYGGLPIPKISTSEVDIPNSASAGQALDQDRQVPSDSALSRTWAPNASGVSPSDDSLLTPRGRRPGRSKGERKDSVTYSGESSDDELDDSDSEASGRSDGSASPSVSPSATPNSSVEKLTNTSRSPRTSPQPHDRASSGTAQAGAASKVPRSKQVIMRKMYKRYLISTPPPILVIHLKRFQQMAKVHTISLSGGFKKLDDFVAFPEYLDLAPFLAPKREDFVHGKDGRNKGKHKREKCMYRLYAVIVHIGNMLGGHYVAYTALPQNPSQPTQQSSPPPPTPSAESEKSAPSLTSQDSRSSLASDQKQPRKWAYISDTVVRLATLEEVLKAKAYICMYERV
ncbi:hypothetical protein BN946_scf184845.g48 [Trametes cinnabarina]|uniref:USP domain-containing protein n=1 Tax=Pycnoporus cinnabarinus TaxID=5643 RepID=A0A060SFK6_PYCCI|nr:hypothetical protein BN946_scf184845.g48 [Trametes cinnabarina]